MVASQLQRKLNDRQLHLFVLVDVSGSMAPDGKMQALNTALEEVLPHLRRVADDAPGLSVFVRAATFGSTAGWIGDGPVAIGRFAWEEVQAEEGALTELGTAIVLLLDALRRLPEASIVPPAILLVSDGLPTDVAPPTFEDAMQQLERDPLGRSTVRMALGIGRDADVGSLQRFVGDSGGELMRADNPQQLMVQIRVRVSAIVRSASEFG